MALGRALAERSTVVATACNDRLRAILKLPPGAELPEVHAAPTSELATRILGRYLELGAAADADESRTLARPGLLALHETSMTTLVKLFLVWRDVTLLELRDLAEDLGTPPPVLRNAEEITRASCDASLVRMMKRFDERRLELEDLLRDERTRLVHEAKHDQLTGLLNRRAFLEMVRLATAGLGEHESIAVMFIDLDGFKEVNDSYGHRFGDQLLQAVAARLEGILRDHDTAGRIGGDEFVVLCRQVRGGPEIAQAVAQRLCDALGEPFEVEGRQVTCPASIGLVVCSSMPDDPAVLLAQADRALYDAKRAGKGRVALG
jgi:diguanylate cyclase (GGDEF)-like protein